MGVGPDASLCIFFLLEFMQIYILNLFNFVVVKQSKTIVLLKIPRCISTYQLHI